MKEGVLEVLRCPDCGSSSLKLNKENTNHLEIRSGKLICPVCAAEYLIEDGIIDFLHNASKGVLAERKAMDEDDYIIDDSGNKFKITDEVIQRFRNKFLVFPEGDGSAFFKRGGSFQSTAEASGRFYSAMEDLQLTGKERILEIGACFSYASFKFAQKGSSVVALDISNYLKVSSLYVEKAYFERVFSDMHKMPFVDNSFDIVFGSAVLHHSKNLKAVFAEIKRVLRAGGKLVLINEAARGILERIHPVYKKMEDKGFGDTAYTLLEWKQGAKAGGFKKVKIILLSFANDLITKNKNRGGKLTFIIRLAYFFKKHHRLEKFLLWFIILPRFLTRPKSWKLICYKNAED
ncbi:MAG: methyltransferase domain-containing protein [Candidatus Omnitrophica bacterium]|nr:methyltransferase domain-containing protein [Candidatus Omnitrophota bacterium]MBU1923367.1 methyltransferase domain-containing protein [Candidatus Omnitrophota bacterium]